MIPILEICKLVCLHYSRKEKEKRKEEGMTLGGILIIITFIFTFLASIKIGEESDEEE